MRVIRHHAKLRLPVLALFIAAAQAAAAFPPPAPDQIQEIRAGKRDTADAAWWGFDPADATKALQAAVDSKARRVIVPDVGAPWIVRGIKLASDQEIVFAPGVEVRALRGAFQGSNDCLFSAREKKNIKLTGPGATLRMWKADYQGADYTRSEWRHALGFWSCEGVTVSGLKIVESGGDGIYLGCNAAARPNTGVVIRDVQLLDHHRQGISVICAERLLIENCVLRGTSGTAPQAGIDFEPNHAAERLVDCVMRNCTVERNAGGGFLFALDHLGPQSPPISITIENCRSIQDRQPVSISLHPPTSVAGDITFKKCDFADSTHGGILLRNQHVDGARVTFAQCRLARLADADAGGAPICFRSNSLSRAVGGARWDDCVIEDAALRRPFSFQSAGLAPLREVTGRITVRGAGKELVHELTVKLLNEWFPAPEGLVDLPVVVCEPRQLAPAWPQPASFVFPRGKARQRDRSHFVIWARKGQRVTVTLESGAVGKRPIKPLDSRLLAPSGKRAPLMGAGADRTFEAGETGAHELLCDPGSGTVIAHAPEAPLCALAPDGVFSFIYPAGDQYFLVPAGVAGFAVTIAGNGAEKVRASIFDSAGKLAWSQDNIDGQRQFNHKRTDASRDEAWMLRCERPAQGVCEDYHVWLTGIPPLLAASPESLLVANRAPAAIARANALAARPLLLEARRWLNAEVKEADPVSGLLMNSPGNRVWSTRDTAADVYPFFTWAAHLLAPEIFAAHCRRILDFERAQTCPRGRLPWDYDTTRRAPPPLDDGRLIFGASEYVKDGLVPIVELLGRGPWSDRMREIEEDCFAFALWDTPAGRLPMDNLEVNGDHLQSLARLYAMTRDQRHLEWAQRIAEHYFAHAKFRPLELRDHNCEIISGFALLWAVERQFGSPQAARHEPLLREMLDYIVDHGLTPDGLMHGRAHPEHKGPLPCPSTADLSYNWGYNFVAFLIYADLAKQPAYAAVVEKALRALADPRYHAVPWARGGYDRGLADSVEGAIYLLATLPVPEAQRWVDAEAAVLEGKKPWPLDKYGANIVRTALLYARMKTCGTWVHPWRADVVWGAVERDGELIVSAQAEQPWQGRLVFDAARHATVLGFAKDYPRINCLPAYFIAQPDARYEVSMGGTSRTVSGAELSAGLPLELKAGIEVQLRVRPAGTKMRSP